MITNILKPLFDRKPFTRTLSTANSWVMASLMLSSLWIAETHAAREILVMDEHCTINVLNRTVQVDEDGFFTLDNVPSNMGQIKARATCLQEGKLVTAESEYFSVPTNGRVSVGEFFKADGNSVPVELQITNEAPITLKKEGATERLSIIARYRNGNTRDVTAVVNGVNYTPSNPDVIRVDANGLITALRSGSSLITARKDGVVGIARVNVVTSGDSDNDGIPDDIEMANGMNPRDPVDAFEDVDNDGLSALEEYQQGTDINNADSDGDGIKDGEELITGADGFITNPMIADTDGDGLTDGQEVEAGSDPTDVNSANYSELLVGITATPGEAVLFYNTLDGESSVQLKVTGTLLDGTEVDLTRTSRQTTYQSSDNLIANFGVEDGRIYAGQDGIATIVVNNNGFTTDVQITVSSFAPRNISNLLFNYNTNLAKLHLDGDVVYLASGIGLHAVDISDVENPVESRRIEIEGGAKDVDVALGQIYVFTGDKALVYDQQTLELSSELILPAAFNDVVVTEEGMVVATESGFHVYSLAEPRAPKLISSEISEKSVKSVDLNGSLLVAVVGNDLLTFSAGSLNTLTQLSQFTLLTAGQVELYNEYAFVSAAKGSIATDFHSIVDLTNAVEPKEVIANPRFNAVDLVHAGNYVLYADQFAATNAIPVINVKQVSAPAYQALIRFSTGGGCSSIDANLAFAVCNDSRTLRIIQYRKLQDLSGIAPKITWKTPDYSSTLSQRRSYRVTADVTDDVEVAIVNFYANNKLVFSDTSKPYTFIHKVAHDATNQTYRVDAMDLASNKASTGNVIFPVIPTGANEENWEGVDYDYFDEDFLALSITMDNSRFVAPYKLEVIENFVAKGGQEVTVFVDELNVGGDLIIEANTALIVKSDKGVNINGNLILKEGARLTVPSTIENNYVELKLDVAGDVTLLEGAQINLDGKGYNLRHTGGPKGELDSTKNGSWACHGGARANLFNKNCSYGQYDNPVLAGSAGVDNGPSYPASGGGVLILKASDLNLADTAQVSANGLKGYTRGAGAGGSIKLSVNRILGAGNISVKGGAGLNDRHPSGGGGRIAIYLQNDTNFTGEIDTSGGSNAGSGTLFKKYSDQQWGELTIDGNNLVEVQYSTPLPNIGRHEITAVESTEAGVWTVSVNGSPWDASNKEFQQGHIGRQLILDANLSSSKRYQVISNTINQVVIESADDLSGIVGSTLSGVYIFDKVNIVNNGWLDIGEDQLIVLDSENSRISKGTLSFEYSVDQALIENAITHGGNIYSKSELTLGSLNLELTENNAMAKAHIRAPSMTIVGDVSLSTVTNNNDPLIVSPRKLDLSLNNGLNVSGNVLLDDFIVQAGRFENLEEKHLFPMSIEAGGEISILGGSKISADGAGYGHTFSFPDFSQVGSLSHGGLIRADNNPVYGNYWFARFAGRGNDQYSFGGGIVHLKANNIINKGTISANGTTTYRSSYAAAGGSVHIETASFTGRGKVYANAARNTGYEQSSGGRISVLALDNQFTGEYLARSVTGVASIRASGAGTVFLRNPVEKYGHLIVSGNGNKELKSTPIKSVGEHLITASYSTIPGEWVLRVAGEPWQKSNNRFGYGLKGIEILLGDRNPSGEKYLIKSNTTNTLTILSDEDLSNYRGESLVGIHTFKKLTVDGTASVDFGKDVIDVLELENSQVSSGASLYAGSALISNIQISSAGGHLFIDSWGLVPDVEVEIGNGHLTLYNDIELNSFVLNSGSLNLNNLTAKTIEINNSSLNVDDALMTDQLRFNSSTVSVNSINTETLDANDSNLTAPTINATNINLTKGLVVSDDITAKNDISLVEGAVISTFAQEKNPNRLFTLDISAKNSVSIDETSKIDVSWKGYLDLGYSFDHQYISMHTGLIKEDDGYFLGSLKMPSTHGGGYNGGGVLHLNTMQLNIDGKILANGGYYRYAQRGAGGSILLEADRVVASASSLISAAGQAPYTAGSTSSTGGRISIIADEIDNLGTFSTHSNNKSASGTTLLTINSRINPDLIIDNNNFPAIPASTLMPSVGTHEIVDAYKVSSGLWQLRFSSAIWKVAKTNNILNLNGVYVDLDHSIFDENHEYMIEKNTADSLFIRTEDDLQPFVGKTIRGIHIFNSLVVKGGASVDFGDDEFRVLNLAESEISSESSIYTGYVQSKFMTIVKDGGTLHFHSSDIEGDWIIDFLPATGGLVLEGGVSLDNIYHSSGKLEILGHAEITNTLSSQGAGSLSIQSLAVNHATISSLPSVEIDILKCQTLSLSDVALYSGKNIDCQNSDVLNTVLKIEKIDIERDLDLLGTTSISSYPQEKSLKPIRLEISVKGVLLVDELATINQTGNGYRYLGPIKSIDEQHLDNRYGANGGIPTLSASQTSYSKRPVGRYERPYYPSPAVSGDYLTAGGAIDVITSELRLNGKIISNGQYAWRRDSSAGGSIYVEARKVVLGEEALISAQSVAPYNTYQHTGSGGRIAVITSNFIGNHSQLSANASSASTSGSGTAFIKDPVEELGSLVVDNKTTLATQGSTPLRTVGVHNIVSIYPVDEGWKVIVQDQPWFNTELPWSGESLDGLWVTFATNSESKKYKISSNASNTLYIKTDDDLSIHSGGRLQGIHRFKSLKIIDGGSVDLGGDLLEVIDVLGSEISGAASITSSYKNLDIIKSILKESGSVYISDGFDVEEISLNSGSYIFNQPINVSNFVLNDAKLKAEEIVANTVELNNSDVSIDKINAADLTLSSKAILVAENLYVAGKLKVLTESIIKAKDPDSINKEVYPLFISVGDTFIVDSTSFIDANTKGYPYSDLTPGFKQSSVYSAGHGGLALNKSNGAFGRFDSPKFAGASGYGVNGGGIINIDAKFLNLEGSIRANGAYGRDRASAGGTIAVDVGQLTGAGSLFALGGDASISRANYSSGGGGRIALFVQDDSNFNGTLEAHGGRKGDSKAAGAGTIFKKYDANKYGQLKISNSGIDALEDSTPINGIGKKTIDRVERISPRVLRLHLLEANYNVLHSTLVQNLSGLEFNIENELGILKQLTVIDNGTSYLDIESYEELILDAASFVQGVFKFETLDVSDGAFVDWKDNLYVDAGVVDSVEDHDGDYLSDVDEAMIGTDKTLKDTDGDGLWDGIESAIGSDPLVNKNVDLSPYVHSIEILSTLSEGRLDLETEANNFSLSYNLVLKIDNKYYYQSVTGSLLTQFIVTSSDLNVVTIDSETQFRGLSAGNSQLTISLFGNEASYIVNVSDVTNHVYLNEEITFDSDRTTNSITLNGSQLIATESELVINGDLLVSVAEVNGASRLNEANLKKLTINGNLVIDNADFTINIPRILVSGNVSLINGAKLTTVESKESLKKVFGIELAIGGLLTIDEESKIDADGKGYLKGYWSGPDYSFKTRHGCYGGIPLGGGDCAYGQYKKVQFAGSGGYNSNGGGLIVIKANSADINGVISASSGKEGNRNYGYTAAAGGGIHVEVEKLTGTGSFHADALGQSYYQSGAGGRISVYASENEFNGSYTAVGARSRYDLITGAGTVYVKSNESPAGNLIIENPIDSRSNVISKSTPIRTVGRHIVKKVSQVTDSGWRVEVSGDPWKVTDLNLGWGIQGIEVDLDSSDDSNSIYEIVSNTENTILINTKDDLSGFIEKEMLGVHTLNRIIIRGEASVDFGEDRVNILEPLNSEIDEFSELIVGEFDSQTEQVFIYTANNNIKGKLVINNDLLNGDAVIDLKDNQILTLNSLVSLKTLHIKSGNIYFPKGLALEDSMVLSGNAKVSLEDILNIKSINLEGSSILNIDKLTAQRIILKENSTLVTHQLTSKDLTLLDSSTLTVDEADINSKTINDLKIDVENLIVSQNSNINVDSKGYPIGSWSGPDFSSGSRYGCHGGIRSNAVDCTYGNYKKAKFAGSGGYSNGGGLIDIHAINARVDGVISANSGINGNQSSDKVGGAGGGIHLEVEKLIGDGSITANAEGPSYYFRGAGGRISVYAALNEFSGKYSASGLRSKGGYITGAGTVYLQQSTSVPGVLFVENSNDNNAAIIQKGTPIKSIGRHEITRVSQVANNQWRLEVPGSPWKTTDESLDWGIQGLDVTLDASDSQNTIYKIISNTENTILIKTENDLSVYVGKEMLGVHTLDRIIIRGKASVDFGEDRLIILDPLNSEIDENSELYVGELNPDAWNVFAANIYKKGALLSEHFEVSEEEQRLMNRLLTPQISINKNIDLINAGNKIKVRWSGLLNVPQDGLYSFAVDTQGLTKVVIDGVNVLSVDCCGYSSSSSTNYTSGMKEIVVEYESDINLLDIDLLWVRPGETEQPIPSEYFSYRAPGIKGEMNISGEVILDDEVLFSNNTHKVNFDKSVNAASLSILGGDFTFKKGLSIDESLVITGGATLTVNGEFDAQNIYLSEDSSLFVNEVNATGLFLNSSILEARTIRVKSLELHNGSTLTGELANIEEKSVYPLMVKADSISISSDSIITMDGKGYPANYWSGPEFKESEFGGCHAGLINENQVDCTYGNYEVAKFAGSAGSIISGNRSGNGGGIIKIESDVINIDGTITASGERGGRYRGAAKDSSGSGGSIQIIADEMSGVGNINVNGTSYNTSYVSSSAGRISIFATNNTYSGQYSAKGAIGQYQVSGAGTIYLKSDESDHGELIIENMPVVNGKPLGITPLRHVGMHKITGVYSEGGNEWRLQFNTASWKASTADGGHGLQGLSFKFIESGFENLKVLRNTENTLLVNTEVDLQGIVGKTIVGVQTLRKLVVKGAAKVDFGDDHLIVEDIAGSQVEDTSELVIGNKIGL